jgi:hypothetical protein
MFHWTNQDCNVNACGAQGNNVLHLAVYASAPAAVIAGLMTYKADALKANTNKKTPLELAIAADVASGYVQVIIPHIPEAQLNKPLPCGGTAFEYALVRSWSRIQLKEIHGCAVSALATSKLHCTEHEVQKVGNKPAAAALIMAGADVQKKATSLVQQALEKKDDLLLGALVFKVKQSVLDTLDIDYMRMVAAGHPKAAAASLTRQHQNPRMLCTTSQLSSLCVGCRMWDELTLRKSLQTSI